MEMKKDNQILAKAVITLLESKIWTQTETKPIEVSNLLKGSTAARIEAIRGTTGDPYSFQSLREIFPMGSLITSTLLWRQENKMLQGIASVSKTIFRVDGQPITLRNVYLVVKNGDLDPELHDTEKTKADKLIQTLSCVANGTIKQQKEGPNPMFINLITKLKVSEILEFDYDECAIVSNNN